MAEERTLGLARARDTVETVDEQPSKEELQRRMEEARDSITKTVTEIKDNVAQQYENVKDALDWRALQETTSSLVAGRSGRRLLRWIRDCGGN